MRRSLQSEVPIAAAMEKPDTEKGSAEAVHPGAAAYYDNNEESFMDRYGDWLYISAMAFSGLGSVIAAMFGLSRARARKAAFGACRSVDRGEADRAYYEGAVPPWRIGGANRRPINKGLALRARQQFRRGWAGRATARH
jgi:hypothetical protein